MKVYTLPSELEATIPQPDYSSSYDRDKEIAAENAHKDSIKQWLKDNGYNGKHTGGILRMPIADGAAEYMLADGNPSILIHLPYGDAWNHPDVTYLPKNVIVKRINADKAIRKMFEERNT